MKNISGYTEGLDREEKGPEKEEIAREAVVLNCIKWSMEEKSVIRVAKGLFNADVAFSLNRCFP